MDRLYPRTMLARRLLLFAALLLLLSALVSGAGSRRTLEPPPPSALPPAADDSEVVTQTIPVTETDARVSVQRGQVLELSVEGDVLDAVLLERLDRMDGIAPYSPARFSILADAPAGLYPIRLVGEDRPIGVIEMMD